MHSVMLSFVFEYINTNCFNLLIYSQHPFVFLCKKIIHNVTIFYGTGCHMHCSAVWCSAADTHIILLDREVSGVRFLTEGVFECNIAPRQPVAVLYMLYKICCNPMHLLYDAL